MLCIPRGGKHSREAWDLLVWMQSDEAQLLFAGAMNNVPNTIRALRAPTLRSGAAYRQQFGFNGVCLGRPVALSSKVNAFQSQRTGTLNVVWHIASAGFARK